MYTYEFVKESNKIEGILREPTSKEIIALEDFIDLPEIFVADVSNFVAINQPGAILRDKPELDVQVGTHLPPPGGPKIREDLETLLERIYEYTPYQFHNVYETLHPYTDGNGRSGRAIWAWSMVNRHGLSALKLGFLHRWYYQSLQEGNPFR